MVFELIRDIGANVMLARYSVNLTLHIACQEYWRADNWQGNPKGHYLNPCCALRFVKINMSTKYFSYQRISIFSNKKNC